MARKLVSFDPDAPSGSKLPSAVQTELEATYAPLVGGGVVTVTSPTDAAIRAALAALGAAGGIIHLPAGEITLTSPLPRRSGVLYQGVPPVAKPSNNATPAYLGDMEPIFVGGTILKGNGTFACFEANPTDQVSSPATPGADQITGGGVRDVQSTASPTASTRARKTSWATSTPSTTTS